MHLAELQGYRGFSPGWEVLRERHIESHTSVIEIKEVPCVTKANATENGDKKTAGGGGYDTEQWVLTHAELNAELIKSFKIYINPLI